MGRSVSVATDGAHGAGVLPPSALLRRRLRGVQFLLPTLSRRDGERARHNTTVATQCVLLELAAAQVDMIALYAAVLNHPDGGAQAVL